MRPGVPPSRLAAAVFLVVALASPAGAQTSDDAAVAPAIGPWLGATRGTITEVGALDGGIAVGVALVDPDGVTPIDFEVVVDGVVEARERTDRADDFGATRTASVAVDVDDGVHDVCLRVLDARFGPRTVDCTRATTSPPDTVQGSVADAATGVVVSPTGVVVPVVQEAGRGWDVVTPCGGVLRLNRGTFVDRARVVIDPGHGGSESGAVNGSLFEKNLNLVIAEEVVRRLESLGISAQLTRTSDYRLPIRTRADIANALAPDVFLSIHHNGGATRPSSRPGTEVFYSATAPGSERLARVMYEELVDSLQPLGTNWVSTVSEGASLRLRGDGSDLYGIHRFSPDITSVITEYLYLSHGPEAALMRRPEMIGVEAQAIIDGLLRWWWTEDTGTTRGRQFVDESSSGTGGFDGCIDPDIIPRVSPTSSLYSSPEPATSPTPSLFPALFLAVDPAID